MNVWHLTSDAARIPHRVSDGEAVHLEIGTWPIEPRQRVWIEWEIETSKRSRETGCTDAKWRTNWGANSYWDTTLGPFQSGDRVRYTSVHTSRQAELQKYRAVIHLNTPLLAQGYNHINPLRIESAAEAAEVNRRILAAWDGHPKRFVVESVSDFLEKARNAVEPIRAELPEYCRTHEFLEFQRPSKV